MEVFPVDGAIYYMDDIDPDLLDLLPGYLARRRQDVALAQAAASTGDFRTIEIIGHRLKGNAAQFGFVKLETVGRELEQAALAKDVPRINNAMRDLALEVDELSARLGAGN